MKSVEATKREVKAEKARLVERAEQDKEERREIWTKAVRLFNEHSQALYRTPGDLVIDISEVGYKFHVKIERSGSEGIEKMKIFCFDLALLELQLAAGRGIDFLIHDSLMYDAVDGRQTAKALERAHEVTSALGGQYICAMNSDTVPQGDFSKDFVLDDHVRLTLTDDTPAGRLLGMEFERK